MHLLGVKWDNETRQPFLLYRERPNADTIIYKNLKVGDIFSLTINREKFCVGTKNLCPFNTELTDNQFNSCRQCSGKDSTYFLSLNGLTHDQVEELKKVPYYNYITLFGQDVIKTGVTAHSRKFSRILEQGGSAAIYLTDCDGYVARQIERYISTNLHIRQAIGWEQKAKLLSSKIDERSAQKKLKELSDKVFQILPLEYKTLLFQESEYFFNSYISDIGLTQYQETLFLQKMSPADTISGKISGVYGSMVLIETDEKTLYYVNIHSLIGHIIELNEKSQVMNIKAKVKILTEKKQDMEVLGLF